MCFARATGISYALTNANSLLLLNPLEVLSFSYGWTLYLVVWTIFIFDMLSASFRLSTSTTKFLFRIFFTFFGVAFVDRVFL